MLVGIAMAAESGAPVLSTLHRHFLPGEIQQLSMDERLLRVADGVFTWDAATRFENRAGLPLGSSALRIGAQVRLYLRAGSPTSNILGRVVVQRWIRNTDKRA